MFNHKSWNTHNKALGFSKLITGFITNQESFINEILLATLAPGIEEKAANTDLPLMNSNHQ
jgi:hypothetical protein